MPVAMLSFMVQDVHPHYSSSQGIHMIHQFSTKPLPAIIFGAGCLSKLPAVIEPIGTRILIVTGEGFFHRETRWAAIEKKLTDGQVIPAYARITAEPSPEDIDTVVEEHTGRGCDGVVAIGGGSVIDAGKAISAMLPRGEKIERFLEGVGDRQPDGKKLPFIAVPTTAGTGSEASANAVITKPGPSGFKKSLRHDRYVPDVALIDPELMRSCPPALTAACAMDTFTQLVEGFLSTKSSPITDAIGWSGISAVQRSLVKVFAQGDDLEARTDMAYAALCSGIVLANAGLGIIHGLAPTLGSGYSIPHGLVCGTLMAAGNEITLRKLKELRQTDEKYQLYIDKYERLGRLFDKSATTSENGADRFIYALQRFTEVLGLPRLSAYGVTAEHLDQIIETSSGKNNPAPLSKVDIHEILMRRL